MRRLLESGIHVFDISHLFLTHFHPDHSGELASLLFSFKYGNRTKIQKPLTIIGGKGLITFFHGLKTAYGNWIETNPRLIEMEDHRPDTLQFENFAVTSIPVVHNNESIAFRVADNSGTNFVYSGDTDFSDNLISLSMNTHLLICESSHPDDQKAEGHLTPSLAGKIARQAKVRQLILTHFYPECEKADIENQCRKTYEGPLILAEDLMEIHLQPSQRLG